MASDAARIALDLVGIGSDTYSQGEKEVAGYVHEKLTARLGCGEGLMLNGHTDTVPVGDPKQWRYPYSGRIANGRLYGRGSSDMKGGPRNPIAHVRLFSFIMIAMATARFAAIA